MASNGNGSPKRAFSRIALSVALAAVALCALGFGAAAILRSREPTVEERWTTYIEALKPESKLVVLTSRQRYTASREFTAKLLAVVKVKASIELSAWADVSYYVDLSDASAWSISWDRKARRLEMRVPAPGFLPPAVRTETIEIKSRGANIVTNTLFRLKEEAARMQSELSSDISARAALTLVDPEIVSGAREGVAQFGASFCRVAFGVEPANVAVRFVGE